jgi:hypothetical protein
MVCVALALLLLVDMIGHIIDKVVQQLMWQLASISSTSLWVPSLHISTAHESGLPPS